MEVSLMEGINCFSPYFLYPDLELDTFLVET